MFAYLIVSLLIIIIKIYYNISNCDNFSIADGITLILLP